MSGYYYIEPGETVPAAHAAALAAAGITVVVAAAPTGTLAAGMVWQIAPPALVGGVLTQQWTQVAAPALTPQQQAAAILGNGCQVVSTSTPALNATYPLDQAHLTAISELVTGIAAGAGLPGGAATVNIPDVTGAQHAFTATQLVALGAALRNVFYDCEQVLTGQSTTVPAQPATIA